MVFSLFMKYMLYLVMLLMIVIINNSMFSYSEFSFMMSMDSYVFMIMILVLLVIFLLFYHSLSYYVLVLFLMMTVYFLANIGDIVCFMFMYEFLFILIMFTLLLMGYSYERLLAGFMMMFYSFIFSGPALLLLIMSGNKFLLETWNSFTPLLCWFMLLSFVVKFPIFGFHYWLPIAHVEASTMGSIILASVLLKMGGIGVWYTLKYMNFMMKWHWVSWGILLVMMFIITVTDLKMMVAYSSVAHMTLVFYAMSLGSFMALKGAFFMMFYHGLISSLLFWMIGLVSPLKSRALLVVKGFYFSVVFTSIIFFLCVMNMSFPPFMGFMSEVLMIKSVLELSMLVFFVIICSVLLTCFYNMYFYIIFTSYTTSSLSVNTSDLTVIIMLVYVMFLIVFY